jgi:hypothetical protein
MELRAKIAPPHGCGTSFAFTPIAERPEAVKSWNRACRLREIEWKSIIMQTMLTPCSTTQVKEHPKMRDRRHTLLWMKDLIEHMSRCHDQLEFTSDGETQSFLADAMIGDLNECQKLCEQFRSIQSRQARSPALA